MTDAWLQHDGESDAAFAAFALFLDLGPGRTMDDAYRAHRGRNGGAQETNEGASSHARAPGRWRQWAREWCWKDRAQAYDNRVQTAKIDARVAAVVQAETVSAGEWAQRAQELRQDEWKARKRMLDLANTIATKIEEQLAAEKSDVPLSPLHVAKLLELSSKVGRLSVGLETDRPGPLVPTEKPLSEWSVEELENARREHLNGSTTH